MDQEKEIYVKNTAYVVGDVSNITDVIGDFKNFIKEVENLTIKAINPKDLKKDFIFKMKNKKLIIACIVVMLIIAIGLGAGLNISATKKYESAMELIEEYTSSFETQEEIDEMEHIYDKFLADDYLLIMVRITLLMNVMI